MGLFTRKNPAPPSPCPACGEPLSKGHCSQHVQPFDGQHVFVCECGTSALKWSNPGAAAMAMELHLDHDHGTRVSSFANNPTMITTAYRRTFPNGAVR